MKKTIAILTFAICSFGTSLKAQAEPSETIEVEITAVTRKSWIGQRIRDKKTSDEMGLVCHSEDSEGTCITYQMVVAPVGSLNDSYAVSPPMSLRVLADLRDDATPMAEARKSMPKFFSVSRWAWGLVIDNDEYEFAFAFHILPAFEVAYVADIARTVTYYPFAVGVRLLGRMERSLRISKMEKDLAKTISVGQPDLQPIAVKNRRFTRLRDGFIRAYGDQK